MNSSMTKVSSPKTPKSVQNRPHTEDINDLQSQPLDPSPFSFKNDLSSHPPASPAGSTSSSIFQSPQGSNPVSPVRMNLPDASSYSNISVNYNSLTSPPPKFDSPHAHTNQGHSPHVAYDMQRDQQLQQSYDVNGLPSPVEFIEGTTAHTERLRFSVDSTTGRAVTPIISSQDSFPTSVASPTPRAIFSPKNLVQRSLKSSTESLKPPLPIVSSNEKLDQISVGRDLDTNDADGVNSRLISDSASQTIESPDSFYSEEDLPASKEHLPHKKSVVRANHPASLNFDSKSDSLSASESREDLQRTFDKNRGSSAPSTPKSSQHLDGFNKNVVSQSAHSSLKVSVSSNYTPSGNIQKVQSPLSTNFPSIDNYTFEELKTLLSEKLIELSQIQSQNAQLWALVNKQRNMIFDLQKDLDGAVEQNEKYRAILSKPHSSASKQVYSSSSPSISISPFSQSKSSRDFRESSPNPRLSDATNSVKYEKRDSAETPSQLTPKGASNLATDENMNTKSISFNDSIKSIPSLPRKSVESTISKQETVFSMPNSLSNSKEPSTPSQFTSSVASTPYQHVDGTPYIVSETFVTNNISSQLTHLFRIILKSSLDHQSHPKLFFLSSLKKFLLFG